MLECAQPKMAELSELACSAEFSYSVVISGNDSAARFEILKTRGSRTRKELIADLISAVMELEKMGDAPEKAHQAGGSSYLL